MHELGKTAPEPTGAVQKHIAKKSKVTQKRRQKMNLVIRNIKLFLKKRGLKQKTLAERAGYTEQKFSRMMTEHSPIMWEDILNIANALDVAPYELLKLTVEEQKTENVQKSKRK